MSARIAEAAALSFRKRYRSSYETPSPSSSPTLPIRKRYRGTSELLEDAEDESSDSDTKREGLEDESPGLEDEGPGSEDRVLVQKRRRRRLHLRVSSRRGLDASTFEIRHISRSVSGHQNVEETPTPKIPVSTAWIVLEDSTDIEIEPRSLVPTLVASLVTTPAATIAVDEDEFLERATVNFSALWRPMLSLEAWARHVDARWAEMSQARYDDHRLIHDFLVQNTTMQHELQELRGRVTTLEQDMSLREQ
nr:hypothetical protein [Tanacetum cinerariifolium]